MAAFGESRKTVLGERFPRGDIRDELPDRRADARIFVERPHPNADRLGVTRVGPVDRGPASAAEPLLAAVVGLPHSQHVIARDDPKGAWGRVRLCRGGGTAPPLTSPAMAIAGTDERLGHLVSSSSLRPV
jgi:hypothetical protein